MKISFSLNGMRIISHFDDMIRFHINGYHLRHHMQRRFKWIDKVWDYIDHHLFGRHFKAYHLLIKYNV